MRSIVDPYTLAAVADHARSGPSLLSSVSRPRSEISESVKPVIFEAVMVIVQSPEITPPTWSHVPARADGLTATIAANTPPSASVQTIKRLSDFESRPERVGIR